VLICTSKQNSHLSPKVSGEIRMNTFPSLNTPKAERRRSLLKKDPDAEPEYIELIHKLRKHTLKAPILILCDEPETIDTKIYRYPWTKLSSDITEATEFGKMVAIAWAPKDNLFWTEMADETVQNGRLIIYQIDCFNLAPKDSNGLSDPYVILNVSGKKMKTRFIEKTLNPKWPDLNWSFKCDSTQSVNIEVWDKDPLAKDDFEGLVEFKISNVIHDQSQEFPCVEKTFPLEPKHINNKVSGTITLRMGFVPDHSPNDGKVYPGYFGRPLQESFEIAEKEGVIHITTKAIDYIKEHGLNSIGLFRVPGSREKVKILKEKIDAGEDVSLDFETPHDVAALLKVYLAGLPNPVVPSLLFDEFLEVAKIEGDECIPAFIELYNKFPEPNKSLFAELILLLYKISQNHEVNMMSPSNCATCLAPTIVIPSTLTFETNPQTILIYAQHVNSLVEFIICNAETIFASLFSNKK